MENINYKTLLDFSNGKYSYNDYLNVKYWFINIREDEILEKKLFNQWKEFQNDVHKESLRPIFEKIHYQILLEEKKNRKGKSLWLFYRQIAAILIPIMVLSIATYFFFSSPHSHTQPWVEINAPEGARIEFLLPDSTSGWLNNGSKLKYPTTFGSHRQVELMGEAFFNVKHKQHSDFTVSVTDMDIKVLGTQFNVSAYSNEPYTEVVLKEGKVEIKGKEALFSKTLQPKEKILYSHKTNSFNMQSVDPDIYTAWKDGYLIINNEPLGQAAKKIGRWYNAEITIKEEALKSYRFKGTFNEEPLDEVLRFIAMTTPINYTVEKRDFDKKGILGKKKVTIKLR